MIDKFILKKAVDKSIFKEGFHVPARMQKTLSKHLSGGELEPGEKRTMRCFLEDISYEVTLRNENFDREKYPTHAAIWQFNYKSIDPIAIRLREIFSSTYEWFFGAPKRSIKDIPVDLQEFLLVRSTWLKDTFHFEPIANKISVDRRTNEIDPAERRAVGLTFDKILLYNLGADFPVETKAIIDFQFAVEHKKISLPTYRQFK